MIITSGPTKILIPLTKGIFRNNLHKPFGSASFAMICQDYFERKDVVAKIPNSFLTRKYTSAFASVNMVMYHDAVKYIGSEIPKQNLPELLDRSCLSKMMYNGSKYFGLLFGGGASQNHSLQNTRLEITRYKVQNNRQL